MSYRVPVDEIHRLAMTGRADAVGLAEQVVDAHAGGFSHQDERSLALDALLRDLARLRRRAPDLDGFITTIESHIDSLHRDLVRLAA